MTPFRYSLGIGLCAFCLIMLSVINVYPVQHNENNEPDTRVQESAPPMARTPIHISADLMVTDNNSQTAEFNGNVKAAQGTTQVMADRLVLHYTQSRSENSRNAADNIEKVVALGHVKIVFDNWVAVSEQAVYTTSDRRLVLSGKKSTITSDGHVITGDRIVFDRDKGRMEINGTEKKQVEAVLQPDQRGLN